MKLKKVLATVVASSLMLLLAACAPSAQKINDQAIQASKTIKNGHMQMDFSMGRDGQRSHISSDVDFQLKPHMTIKQKMQLGNLPFDSYLTDKNQYFKMSAGEWIKAKPTMLEKLGMDPSSVEQNINGKSFRINSKKLLDKATIKSNSKSYTLTLKGDSKNNKETKKEIRQLLINSAQVTSAKDAKEMFSDAKIDTVTYTYTVDKKTYLPKSYRISIKYKYLEKEANTKINVKYSQLNSGKKVTVPSDVKKYAIDQEKLSKMLDQMDDD